VAYHLPAGFTFASVTYMACDAAAAAAASSAGHTASSASAAVLLDAYSAPGCSSRQAMTLAAGPSRVAPTQCWQLHTQVVDLAATVGCLPTLLNFSFAGGRAAC
jgi:hypothetical protein